MRDDTADDLLDVQLLRTLLEDAGWDAIARPSEGEVVARLDHPPAPGVWTLYLDRAGHFRFKATRETRPPEDELLERDGLALRLLREYRQVLTLRGQLAAAEELPRLLDELARLARWDAGLAP